MISDARGGHVSPGFYSKEEEVSYSVKSLGITQAGLAGETLKGPAFQTISIEKWDEFVDYFGGTSTEKFVGNELPKFELAYIAKEYLKESKKLHVVRVLGLSGYKTSDAYVVGAKFTNGDKTTSMPLVVLRSLITYDGESSLCQQGEVEVVKPIVTKFEIGEYTGTSFGSNCEVILSSGVTYPTSGVVATSNDNTNVAVVSDNDSAKFGKFSITVTYNDDTAKGEGTSVSGVSKTKTYNVSINPSDTDYIYNVLPSNPLKNPECPIFVEAVYDYAFDSLVQKSEPGTTIELSGITDSTTSDYREPYRCAETPWIVSEVKSAGNNSIDIKKLFKVYTISDGNAANYQVKISIQNIKPEDGTFDLVVRDFYDTDSAPIILEKFSRCTMKEGESNYIGYKVGTFDGAYESKSKYITVRVSDGEGVESCVPAGFLGYPVPNYGCEDKIEIAYNEIYDVNTSTRKQYFGLGGGILDEDIINYKGVNAYSNNGFDFNPVLLTNGFHLDSILNEEVMNASGSAISGATIMVDGVSGFTFSTVKPAQSDVSQDRIPRILTEKYMNHTIYSDVNLRKFTVYPYGGFDGWDIYRTVRTNTDEYKATKYPALKTVTDASGNTTISSDSPFKYAGSGESDLNPTLNLDLPSKAITSDYYAYLGAYNQFKNPHDIEINIFATPGIDWFNNNLLYEDVEEMISDSEEGRGGDALYIPTTPQYNESGQEAYTAEDIARFLDEKNINTSYACTYWPWVKFLDTNENRYIMLPPTKDVFRNIAFTDNKKQPWFSTAGISRGRVECERAFKKLTTKEEDVLYENCINPVKTFGQDGVFIWGNKTLYTKNTPLNRINVRRLMIRIKKLVSDVSKHLIFDQYDTTLEEQFRGLVEPILKNVADNRGISDFRIETECTAETRDQHILPAKILVKPINALEYISVTFTVYPESVEFQD